MTIIGTGSYFAYDGLIAQAGNLADGSVLIFGGNYQFAALDAGVNNGAGPAGISGLIALTAGTSVLVTDLFGQASGGNGFPLFASIGRSYDASHAAYGKLRVDFGASLTLDPLAVYQPGVGVRGGYDTLNAGVGAGGTGVVEVDGLGSTFSTSGTNPVIRIGGAGGTGRLSITDGAEARIFSLQAGFGIASGTVATGDVVVDGAGSRLLLSGAYGSYANPAYAGFAGATTIGLAFGGPEGPATGRGSLTVSNGGEVIQQNIDGVTDFPLLRFGKDTLAYGSGLVEGAGSRLVVIQHGASGDDFTGGATLDIGEAGQGVVTVRDGGRIEVLGDKALLSVARTPDGVPINPNQSSLSILDGGAVTVDAGGYEGGNVQIGSGQSANGRLTLSGTGSRLTLASDAEGPEEASGYGATLLIGRVGEGAVLVNQAARIEIDGNDDRLPGLTIGTEGGTGTLSLDNAELTLSGTRNGAEAARITVGTDGGTGTLTLTNGSTITNTASDGVILIGATPGSAGTVSVDGSSLTTGGQVLVGSGLSATGVPETAAGGMGTLTLLAGSVLTAETLVVGETGEVDLSNATVDADIMLEGTLALSPGALSLETLSGDLIAGADARITADVFKFDDGGTDQLIIENPSAFSLTDLPLSFAFAGGVTFFGGDSFVFATGTAPFQAELVEITDPLTGRPFLLRAEGTEIFVDATLGSPVTLREDGTIGRITLPALEQFLAEGTASSDGFDLEI